ncbi:MAG: hypothetical protein J1F65_01945 [Clostridiales bacterium]|nr:hypothetical protein [Clostridiales bacterium]
MDNKTLAQLYLHAKNQRDYSGMSEYEKQILAIEGFDEEGVTADTIYCDRLLSYCTTIKSLAAKQAKKHENSILGYLKDAENYFAKLKVKSQWACATLGTCYSCAALCYNAKDEGKAKIAAIVERAKTNGLPLENLSELCKNRGLSEQLRAEINDAINAAGKAKFDAEQIELLQHTLPDLNYYENGVQAAAQIESFGSDVGAAVLQAQDQAFCVELFKKAARSKLTEQNVADALNSEKAQIDVSLFYVPVGIVNWEATPAHYRWSWESGSYYANGSFDYGANSLMTCQDLAGSANRLLGNTAGKLEIEANNNSLKRLQMVADAKYVVANNDDLPVPSVLVHTVDEAKNAIAKETGRDAYLIKIELINKARYIYDVKGIMYVPFYAIRIVSGDYVAKGTVNAYYSQDVTVDDVAKVANGSYYSYLGKKFKEGEAVKPPKRRIGLKIVSGLALLAAIAMIAVNFILQGSFFLTNALYPAAASLVLWILTLKGKKKVLWGVLSILAAIASIALSIIYLFF